MVTVFRRIALLRTTEEALGIDEFRGHANDQALAVKAMTSASVAEHDHQHVAFSPREPARWCLNLIAAPIDKHVGRRVCMRRLMLEMSQTQLADGLGLTFAGSVFLRRPAGSDCGDRQFPLVRE